MVIIIIIAININIITTISATIAISIKFIVTIRFNIMNITLTIVPTTLNRLLSFHTQVVSYAK